LGEGNFLVAPARTGRVAVVATLAVPALMSVAIRLSGTSGMERVLGWVLRGLMEVGDVG
jgi:hypothetical protein